MKELDSGIPAEIAASLNPEPKMPKSRHFGIGIVGAGGIVNYAHLPAYRTAGFKVVGITDVQHQKAEQTAREHNIPKVYTGLSELLEDRAVDIVDIAVFPQDQLGVAEQVTAAGKHLLCQKPLSNDYTSAARIVELAKSAGVKLAVNQQMRWSPGIRCAKQLLERGWVGTPCYGTIQVHVFTDWSMWPWMYNGKRLEILFHSIHHIDSLRYLLGMPRRVYSTGWRSPDEKTEAETKTLSVWEYDGPLRVLVDVNHGVRQDDRYAIFRVEGTSGIVKGTIGLLYNYPTGRPDTLEAVSDHINTGKRVNPQFTRLWIPDAFVGPMGSLMCAIEEDSEPETSGEDNLKTLQLVFAEYRSMAEKRAVQAEEIASRK